MVVQEAALCLIYPLAPKKFAGN